jgi:hypothetical protein
MKHPDEAAFLEAYYGVEEDGRAVDAHLASCDVCIQRKAALYRRLDDDRAKNRAEVDRKPESFWKRQEIAIQRKIANPEVARRPHYGRQLAAAALLLVVAGGAWFGRSFQHHAPASVQKQTTVAAAPQQTAKQASDSVAETISTDPWDAEELKGFHQVVQWESWETTDSTKGTS